MCPPLDLPVPCTAALHIERNQLQCLPCSASCNRGHLIWDKVQVANICQTDVCVGSYAAMQLLPWQQAGNFAVRKVRFSGSVVVLAADLDMDELLLAVQESTMAVEVSCCCCSP